MLHDEPNTNEPAEHKKIKYYEAEITRLKKHITELEDDKNILFDMNGLRDEKDFILYKRYSKLGRKECESRSEEETTELRKLATIMRESGHSTELEDKCLSLEQANMLMDEKIAELEEQKAWKNAFLNFTWAFDLRTIAETMAGMKGRDTVAYAEELEQHIAEFQSHITELRMFKRPNMKDTLKRGEIAIRNLNLIEENSILRGQLELVKLYESRICNVVKIINREGLAEIKPSSPISADCLEFISWIRKIKDILTADSSPPPPKASGAHPEDICIKCGRQNAVWFTDNEVWNRVIDAEHRYLTLCPVCFIQEAESKGLLPTGWKIVPEDQPAAPQPTREAELLEIIERAKEKLTPVVMLADLHSTDTAVILGRGAFIILAEAKGKEQADG